MDGPGTNLSGTDWDRAKRGSRRGELQGRSSQSHPNPRNFPRSGQSNLENKYKALISDGVKTRTGARLLWRRRAPGAMIP